MERATVPRVAIISGGTRGLGRATAEHLASQGTAIALCGRNAVEAATVAAELADDHHVLTLGAGADVASTASVIEFSDRVRKEFGRADLLVNNAAVLGPVGALTPATINEWTSALDVNTAGSARMIAAFAELLSSSGCGRIVNLSGGGVGGPTPMQRTSSYVVSKFAVVALTEAMAPELERRGITINAIAPGPIPTHFLDPVVVAGPDAAGQALFEDAAGRRNQPVGESAVAYLRLLDYVASDAAGWLTGRMLSARWETPEALEAQRPLGAGTYVLRRIDGALYRAVHE